MADATVVGRVAIKVMPETKSFRRDAQRALDRIERMLEVEAQLKVDLDRESVQHAKDKLRREFDKFKAEIKIDPDEFSVRKAQLRMAWLSRDRFARIFPVVDKAAAAKAVATLSALSGIRAMKDLGDDFAEWLGNLDRSLPKVAVLGTGLINLGSFALTATSNLFSLAGSLVEVGQAGLALPGILGGLAIGVGATIAVLKDFNKELPFVKKRLSALQNSMSSRFWDQARRPIAEMVRSLLPEFSRGLNRTATSLGRFFTNFSGASTKVFKGELLSMFADLNKSIEIAGKHSTSFVGIIEKLGSVGAGNLPKLAGWVGDISDSFDKWLGKKGASGELQGFVDTGVSALSDLGNVIRYTSSTLAGLARAAKSAGGSTLNSLATTMQRIAKQVNGKTFQRALGDAFRGAHEGMDEITSRSGPAFRGFMLRLSAVLSHNLPRAGAIAGNALSAIFKAFDTKNVSTSLDKVIGNLDRAIRNLAPAVGPAVVGLAGVLRAASELAVKITGALAPAVETLGPKLASLADDLTPFINALGNITKLATTVASGALAAIPNSLIIAGAGMFAFSTLSTKVSLALATVRGRFASTTNGIRAGIPTWAQWRVAVTGVARPMDILNSSLGRTATTVRQSRAAVGQWARGMAGTAGQVALLAVATSGLADKMGMSNTASMAFAGSLAGPWGAAIGAAIGMTMDLSAANAVLEQAISRAEASLGTSTSAMKANLTALQSKMGELDKSFELKGLLNQTLPASINRLKTLYAVVSGTYSDAQGKIGLLKNQLSEPPPKGGLTDILTQGLDAASRAAINLDGNLQKLNGTLDRRANMRDFKQSIVDATNALRDNGKGLGTNSEAARRNQAQLDGIARAALRVADGLKGADRKQFMVGAAASIQSVADKMAKAKGNAEGLGKKLLGFPKKVPVDFQSKGLPKLQGDANKAKTALQGISKVKANLNPFAQHLQSQLQGTGRKIEAQAKSAANKAGNAMSKNIDKPVSLRKMVNSFMSQSNSLKGKAGTAGHGIGSNLGAGTAAGIGAWIGPVAAKAAAMVNAAVAAAKRAGDIRSPSRKTKKIGFQLAAGLVAGLSGERSKIISTMSKLIGDLNRSGHKGLAVYAGKVQKTLVGLGKTWEEYGTKIQQVSDYTNNVVNQITQSGSAVGASGVTSFKGMVAVLTKAVDRAKAFATTLDTLKKLKLNKITFDQLVQAGPEAALQVAQSLTKAGKAGVDQINKLQSALNVASNKAATTAADVMFANGGQIVNGLLAGLKAKQAQIAAQMTSIANAMVKAIKKALKIKSPSRVFAEVGQYVGDGFIDGVASKTKKSNETIKKLAVARPILPAPSGEIAGATAGGGSSSVRVINYYAAPGRSVSSKEDLFDALGRARSRF